MFRRLRMYGMDKWKEIWNKRKNNPGESTLTSLIKADGFDSGAGLFNEQIWLKFVNGVSDRFCLKETDSLFEVGCGSGAFLYPFYMNNHKVAGLDYSTALIDIANEAMSDMSFKVMEAIEVEVEDKFDIVVSNSVFQYFSSLDYAKSVLFRMIEKANNKVIILDVNDKSKKEKALSLRKGALSSEEYEKKYAGLDHLFYEKSWFQEMASASNCNIEIFDQDIEGYLNSNFRFNVILSKKN